MTFSRKTSLALTLDVLSFLNKEIWAWASLQQEWWVTPPVTPRDWFRPKHRTKDAGDRLFHRISPDYSHFTFSLKKERFQQSKKKKTQGNLLSSFHSGTGYPDISISEGSCKSQGLAAVTLIVLLNWASTSEDSAPLVRIGLSNQSSTPRWGIDKATFARDRAPCRSHNEIFRVLGFSAHLNRLVGCLNHLTKDQSMYRKETKWTNKTLAI